MLRCLINLREFIKIVPDAFLPRCYCFSLLNGRCERCFIEVFSDTQWREKWNEVWYEMVISTRINSRKEGISVEFWNYFCERVTCFGKRRADRDGVSGLIKKGIFGTENYSHGHN